MSRSRAILARRSPIAANCATELTPRRAAFRRWLKRNFALTLSPADLSPHPLLRNPNML